MRTARQVIEEALAEPHDSHERWRHVTVLHARGDEETFRAAAELLDSADPERRSLGAGVLAQLGAAEGVPVEQRPSAPPAAELLVARIVEETDPQVLHAMAVAFGLAARGDERALPPLLVELDDPKRSEDPLGAIDGALFAFAARTGGETLCRHVEERRQAWEAKWPQFALPDDLQAAATACQGHL